MTQDELQQMQGAHPLSRAEAYSWEYWAAQQQSMGCGSLRLPPYYEWLIGRVEATERERCAQIAEEYGRYGRDIAKRIREG